MPGNSEARQPQELSLSSRAQELVLLKPISVGISALETENLSLLANLL